MIEDCSVTNNMRNDAAKAATPPGVLEQQFMNHNTPLNECGHWARREIERLRQCLKWQQDREATIGTHGPQCFMWGHRHYECALREIEQLRQQLDGPPEFHPIVLENRDLNLEIDRLRSKLALANQSVDDLLAELKELRAKIDALEPVAWMRPDGKLFSCGAHKKYDSGRVPLYDLRGVK